MATETPLAGSPADAQVPMGTIQPERNSIVHPVGSPVADVPAGRQVSDPFQASSTFHDAYQAVLKTLDQLCHLIAVVHWNPNAPDQETQPTPLRFNLAGDREKSQVAQLTSVCQQAAACAQVNWRRQLAPDRFIIAFPIASCENDAACTRQSEVLGLIVTSPQDFDTFVSEVERLTGQFALWKMRTQLKHESEIASRAAAAVELVTKTLCAQDKRDTCQVIVTELAQHFDLRRAAIGIATTGSGSCRLTALSDATRIDSTTAQTRAIENAMDEALMFGSITIAGQTKLARETERSAGDLARQHAATVLVVPLVDEGLGVSAAVLVMIDPDTDVEPIQQFLEAARPSLTAVLGAVDQRFSSKNFQRLKLGIRSKAGAIALSIASVCIAAMFLPVRHRETCDVRVEPRAKRFVAAPFDATLKECFVAPGDLVQKGDLLASLDGRELTWKRDALQADHDQAVKKRDAAQASRAYADQRIAQLDIDGIRSELKMLDLRLGELQLRSPVDGIVVAGDLKRATGTPLTTGQSLFEIAPLDEMMVEASVIDDRIAYVRKDQAAELRLNAYPSRTWETTVRIVNPRSEIRDEQNVFIAECLLANENQLLRPGMKGTIKIECGRRPLGWILFHRPLEAISQWLWW